MIRNKEYKIQILLENFKEVEKSENCKNVADYAKIESVADDGFYPWLFEDDYSKVLTSEPVSYTHLTLPTNREV